jgi:hypothetical protein
MAAATLLLGAAATFLAASGGNTGVGAAVSPQSITDHPFQVVVQLMDSCKIFLNGASFALTNNAGYAQIAVGAGSGPSSGASASCPLQEGNCSTTAYGCVVFANVPPGDYRIRQTSTPPANTTNPSGYAPCEGGSACRWEQADVTVGWDGSVAAKVTNQYPNGALVTWPSDPSHAPVYAATAADPIVFHDFGLDANAVPKPTPTPVPTPGPTPTPTAPVSGVHYQCDGDSDADDWSTGTPSSECGYPESGESSVCPSGSILVFPPPAPALPYQFPWTCQTGPSTIQHFAIVSGNAAFVANLYKDVLGRTTAPALSEVQYWVGQILAGMSRATVAAAFVASTEAHGHVVDADYLLMLGRPADPAGRAYWTAQLDQGVFNEHVLGLFGGSPEYYSSPSKGSGNDDTFITSLYRDLLQRTPQPSEVAYWTGRLATGLPRADMGFQISYSHEYHADLVNGWYLHYLGRPTDPGGLAFWTGYLDAGNRDDAGIISILALDEYFAKQGPTFP